jgi:hypothetical protein
MTIGCAVTCTEINRGFVYTTDIDDNKLVDGLSAVAAVARPMAPKLDSQSDCLQGRLPEEFGFIVPLLLNE